MSSSPDRLTVLRPGSEGWDEARFPWNVAADQNPAAIALPSDAEGVAAAVRLAAAEGLRVAAQGTGHGAPALGDLGDTLLVRTGAIDGVEVDPERRLARVGAGAKWADVVAASAPHGLAGLHGSSGTVGVTGYTLGGGIGWISRLHGLASHKVVSFDVVTADGEARRVDAASDPDLFWALRGGGGAFALVTATEFELVPLTEVFGGMVVWPAEQGPEVLDAWRAWTATAPDSISSSFRWLTLPPLPEVPEPLAGKRTVAITAAHVGPAAEAEELLAPLRAIPGATMNAFETMPAPALAQLNGDPEDPVPAISDQAVLGAVDDATAAALEAVSGPAAAGPLGVVEIRHLGGALSRAPENPGALARIDGEFLLFGLGIMMDPAIVPALRPALDELVAAAAPCRTGSYLNFADSPVDTATAFDASTWERLQAIKAAVDPDAAIRSNRPIDPAPASPVSS